MCAQPRLWSAGHLPSLIRVFAVRMKKAWILGYPLSAQRRLWSDLANSQADLSLRWAYTHFVGFVMSRLISKKSNICGYVSVNSVIPKMKITSYFLQWKTTYDLLPTLSAILDCWFKKSSCQLLAKECALSTGKLPRRLAQEQCG